MTQVSSFLKNEVAKYKDIDHILSKLEDDGEVQNIYNNFKKIFDNEFHFTLQELMKIQSSKKETINVKRQCENNLSLFKNNMILIVEMIVEKALKNTLQENKNKFDDVQGTQENQDLQESNANEETVDPSSFQSNSILASSPAPRHRQNTSKSAKSQAVSRERTMNISNDTRGNASHRVERKINFSQLSASKFDSPLSQLLSGTSNTQVDRDNTSFAKDRNDQADRYMTQQTSPRGMTTSYNTLNHSRSSVNHSFVNSEFNHIGGSVRFSRSPKTRNDSSCSPGPAAYDNDKSCLKQNPGQRMGKSPKTCWIDTVSKNDSPGPHLYPSKHFVSNRR